MGEVNTAQHPDSIHLGGDDARTSISEDEFGVSAMAKAMADTLVHRVVANGYVIGIEGKWGSGKSSFVNFVSEQIREINANHQIITFQPWLIGEKDAVLATFFSQFAHAVSDLRQKNLPILQRWKEYFLFRRLRKRLRKYGKYASVLASPLTAASAVDPSGYSALAAVGLSSVPKFLRPSSFMELKLEIINDIKSLTKTNPDLRFTVFIDDIDRLEPNEAVEMLRLVRKVADFPRVAYVMCFDGDALAKHVQTALSVDDGQNHLEKIFQNVVALPPQEPFALRRFARQQLAERFPEAMAIDAE